MTVRKIIRVGTLVSALLCHAVAGAQTPAPSPKKSTPTVKPADRVGSRTAPQVVTIVHRLNGLKMFRMLLRSQDQVQAVASLDSAFNLLDDVHTNVIAGLAMDDGETIAAWLPEAEVEFGSSVIPAFPISPKMKAGRVGFPQVGSHFATPDVTVIGPEGKRIAAKYIGLDGVTGLSILKLSTKNVVAQGAITSEPVETGDAVLLYGPEPVPKTRALFNSLYVRMGAIEGRVQNVVNAPSGDIARFKVSSPKLTQTNIGGVAINEAGETIGIIDGLEGTEATILPASLIRRAAERVLEQQASVPRPWLGVKG